MNTKQRYVAQVNQYVGRKKEADRGLKAQIAAQQANGANGASTSAEPYGGPAAGAFVAAGSPGTPGAAPQQKQIRGARCSCALLLDPASR